MLYKKNEFLQRLQKFLGCKNFFSSCKNFCLMLQKSFFSAQKDRAYILGYHTNRSPYSLHTVKSGSEMVKASQVSGKNIFCSINVDITRGKIIFEIVHWHSKLPANQHQLASPSGWIDWCMSARPLKGQCRNLKSFSSLDFGYESFPKHIFTRDL